MQWRARVKIELFEAIIREADQKTGKLRVFQHRQAGRRMTEIGSREVISRGDRQFRVVSSALDLYVPGSGNEIGIAPLSTN